MGPREPPEARRRKDIISLDAQDTELRYKAEPADEGSPRRPSSGNGVDLAAASAGSAWGGIFHNAESELFEELKVFLSGEKRAEPTLNWREAGMTESAVKVAVHVFAIVIANC